MYSVGTQKIAPQLVLNQSESYQCVLCAGGASDSESTATGGGSESESTTAEGGSESGSTSDLQDLTKSGFWQPLEVPGKMNTLVL